MACRRRSGADWSSHSLKMRPGDPKTRELADDVAWLADAIAYQVKPAAGPLGAWHSNEATHAALSEALKTWLDIIKPQLGPPIGLLGRVDPPNPGLLGPDDPPTLGRATARHLQRAKLSGAFNALALLPPDLQRIQAALLLSGGVLPPGPGLLSPERNKDKKS